jgi:predicted adenine nucleotide alpha hydrolase (AANH) superfamily ATPase
VNYQAALDRELARITASGATPGLLLHSCCAPCGSYALEYLSAYFRITVLYFNPNIYPAAEFERRLSEQKRLLTLMELRNPADVIATEYAHGGFSEAACGLENEREGGARCDMCFALRLDETAKQASARGYEYFGTTLTVGPHKNAERVNAAGEAAGRTHGVRFLYADLKKRDGYKRSLELSKTYNLYRQNYCGCEFSLSAAKGGGEL